MAGVTAIGFPIARALARRIEHGARRSDVPSDMGARLERMEQAIDAMAIELERISEGQRFVTRLMADRASERVPLPGRANEQEVR